MATVTATETNKYENSDSSDTPEQKGSTEEAKEKTFVQKYGIFIVILGVMITIAVVIILAANVNKDSSTKSGGAIEPPTDGVDPTAPTASPTTYISTFDKDGDGKVEFGCQSEPYFDRAGRLIFTDCTA